MNRAIAWALALLLAGLCVAPASRAQGVTVQDGRLICTKQSRLLWNCRIDGNDATPIEDHWKFAPQSVGRMIDVANKGRTARALCESVDYELVNGKLVRRVVKGVVFASYALGPWPAVTRAVSIECDSGTPSGDIMLAYQSVDFPYIYSYGCDRLGHAYLTVQCAIDAGLECTCGGSGGHWTCGPRRRSGGGPFPQIP